MSQRNILLGLLSGILVLRLVIWQFFIGMRGFFREEFSDIAIATLIFAVGLFWMLGKLVGRQSFKRTGLEIPVFLLLLGAACSLFYTVDLTSSLRAVLGLGAGILLFYVLLDLLDNPANLRSTLFFLFGLAFIASFYGLKTYFDLLLRPLSQGDHELQLTNHGLYYLLIHPRAISFFGWPNALAGFLLLFLPLALILPIYLKNVWQKTVACGVLLIFAGCFLCTYSLLSWLSFLLSGMILLPFFKQKLRIKIWPVILIILALFLVVILRKDFLVALSPRLFYYKAAFTLIVKNPLLGWGWNTFGLLSSSMTEDKNILSAYVHNSYLQTLVETGLLGFAGIMILGVFIFRNAMVIIFTREQNMEHFILVAVSWGIIAFLIDNFFSFTILQENVSIYWWAMLAVFCGMARIGMGEAKEMKVKPLVGCLILILIIIFFAMLLRLSGGYTLYYRAQKTINNSDPLRLLGSNSKAIQILKTAKTVDPWSSYLPAAMGESHMRLFGLTRLKVMLLEAKTDYLEAKQLSPKRYYNYFVLSKIYGVLGDKVNEQTFSHIARELSPGEYALDNIMFNQSMKE